MRGGVSKHLATKKKLFLSSKKIPPKNAATKFEGLGGKALMAWPQKKTFFGGWGFFTIKLKKAEQFYLITSFLSNTFTKIKSFPIEVIFQLLGNKSLIWLNLDAGFQFEQISNNQTAFPQVKI